MKGIIHTDESYGTNVKGIVHTDESYGTNVKGSIHTGESYGTNVKGILHADDSRNKRRQTENIRTDDSHGRTQRETFACVGNSHGRNAKANSYTDKTTIVLMQKTMFTQTKVMEQTRMKTTMHGKIGLNAEDIHTNEGRQTNT